MELMPSLRHKAMSPKPDGDGCKHGREQGSRGRSRSRNRCRSLSSTFASRSRSRGDKPKEGDDNKIKPRSRSRSVSWGRDKLGDNKKTSLPSTRYGHLKPAIKKPETITVPIQTPFRSTIRKEEEESPPKHHLPPSAETSVHPPWRYGAEMSSMSSSTEMSVCQKSSTVRRSQLEQRERRVSALKTWPDTTTTPTPDCAAGGHGEVLHFPVSANTFLQICNRQQIVCRYMHHILKYSQNY